MQANLVILPAADAGDFAEFCRLNARPCPLIEQTAPGDPAARAVCAPARPAQRRAALSRVSPRSARGATSRPTFATCGATTWWAFCWAARSRSKTRWSTPACAVRHIEEGRNVPMYRTNVALPAGRTICRRRWWSACDPIRPTQSNGVIDDHGPLPDDARRAGARGRSRARWAFADLSRPDFGDAVTMRRGRGAGVLGLRRDAAIGTLPRRLRAGDHAQPGLHVRHRLQTRYRNFGTANSANSERISQRRTIGDS